MNTLPQLHILRKHHEHLQKILPDNDIFFVGGAIRDLLLGTTDDPADIDLTLAGLPDHIWQQIADSKGYSTFRTEKYGTMTLLPKNPKKKNLPPHTQYEITPFRTEGGYEDNRHPDEITWSHDLLADSKRRDFTINSIYWYGCTIEHIAPSQGQIVRKGTLGQAVQTHRNLFLPDEQVLIIQDHDTIQKLLPAGKVDHTYLRKLLEQTPRYGNKPHSPGYLSLLIDPHGGLRDLCDRKLRCVGQPDDRFQEDALRILRALRFPNILNQHLTDDEYGFDYHKPTRESMERNAHLVSNLAKERIHQELVKVFTGNNPFGYVCLLDELGILGKIFPAVAVCKGDIQPVRYHPFDTYQHTILTLHAFQQISKHYLVKLAMLYHDVGKPEQYAYIAEQKAKDPDNIDLSGYTHHVESGLPHTKKDLQSLGFSNKEIEEVLWYIRRHHRPGEILDGKAEHQAKKLRKLISEAGLSRTLNLLDLAIADRKGQFNPLQPPAIGQLTQLKKLARQIHKEEGRFTMSDLAVDGNLLMDQLDLKAGPLLGKYLKAAFERVLVDVKTRNNQNDILVHLKSLEFDT